MVLNQLGHGPRTARVDNDLEGEKTLRYLVVAMDSTTMKQMLDLLESEGPKSMSYEDICAWACLLYTSPSPRDSDSSRMPSSA